MIELDGAHGEGGGQTVRTALSLSAITGEAFRIVNIRAGRPDPGLKPQHLAGVRLMQRLCSAEVSGDEAGSRELAFRPGRMAGGSYEFDVGTAGSLTLLMQSVLPALFFCDGEVQLDLTGGTDVRWSPPVDHHRLVLLPLLRRMGGSVDMEVMRRGFYPKGGGRVRLRVGGGRLSPLRLEERGELLGVVGVSCVQNLRAEVAERMAASALTVLPGARIEREEGMGASAGAGITLAAEYERTVLGWSALGERGIPAEKVGREAANCLRRAMDNGGTVDARTADQLLPFMALAGDSCLKVGVISGHLESQMQLIPHFLPVRFEVREGSPHRIEVIRT